MADGDRHGQEGGEDQKRSRLHDLGSYIRDQRENNKLSLRKLAKLAGVSNPYLSQIERGLRKPSAEILQAIAKALEISSETLYVRAGILEERDGAGDLVDHIARDQSLTEAQRQALVEMYKSFRGLNEMQHRSDEADGGNDGQQARADSGPMSPSQRFGQLVEAITDRSGDAGDRASARDEDPPEA